MTNDNVTTVPQQNSSSDNAAFTRSGSQGNLQFPPELQQQLGILNLRIGNAHLAQGDLLREMSNTFNAMAAQIAALQKENDCLKAECRKTTTPQQPS
jgi:hypothetical protein